MIKADLVKRISKDLKGLKIKSKKTSKIFSKVFELISKDIRKRKVVEIEGLGEFRIRRQEMRVTYRKDMTKVVMPPKDIVEFTGSEKIAALLKSAEE
jgi:nucleoid DNA-binding protein